jgi:RNase P subunit RPR2
MSKTHAKLEVSRRKNTRGTAMSDTLEMWNDFVRGERVTGKRTKRVVCCNCNKMSNPEHDGKYGISEDGRDVPVVVCDDCDRMMSE